MYYTKKEKKYSIYSLLLVFSLIPSIMIIIYWQDTDINVFFSKIFLIFLGKTFLHQWHKKILKPELFHHFKNRQLMNRILIWKDIQKEDTHVKMVPLIKNLVIPEQKLKVAITLLLSQKLRYRTIGMVRIPRNAHFLLLRAVLNSSKSFF